ARPAFAFDETRQSAVVDKRPANPSDSARPFEGVAANEHASSGSGGGRISGIVYPCERVELPKEEDERRDQRSFPEGAARKLDHERCQVEVVLAGPGDEPLEDC